MSGPATQDQMATYRLVGKVPVATNNFANIPVNSGETIYLGSLVGLDSGTLIPATTGKPCLGMAWQHGEEGEFPVIYNNFVVRIPLSGITADDVGKTAYAADSANATLSSNTAILGPIVDWETGYAWINLTLEA